MQNRVAWTSVHCNWCVAGLSPDRMALSHFDVSLTKELFCLILIGQGMASSVNI